MAKTIKAAMLGFGTVGTGVYKLFRKNGEGFKEKIGAEIILEKILVRDVGKKRGLPDSDRNLLTDDFEEIIGRDDIDIIIEVMGGTGAAKDYILRALAKGKTVVSANKDLFAEYGEELLAMAEENGTDVFFEASVAGGIPIVRALKESLAGNRIEEVVGIINGTTNYILTRMTEDGKAFSEALREAQELGFAEADPSADIDGLDAARKIAILASIAFNSRVTFSDVYVEGISGVSKDDILYASELGYVIKLVAIARNRGKDIEVHTHPMFFPKNHPLASVRDAFNAVFVKGDAVGDAMFYGQGAGEMPTASAVMGDVLEGAKFIVQGCRGRKQCSCFRSLPCVPMSEVESKFFLRMTVADRPGVLSSISGIFGEHSVSIAYVIQKRRKEDKAELVIITDPVAEKNFSDALKIISGHGVVYSVSSVIRVY